MRPDAPAGRSCRFERHDLLTLSEAAWDALLADPAHAAACWPLRAWRARGDPAIRTRAAPDGPPDRIPAAIALAPADGGARLAFSTARDSIADCAAPPALEAAWLGRLAGRLPPGFAAIVEPVLAAAARAGLAPRMFGSAMWQCVTGRPYLRAGSDLDLLWVLPDDVAPDAVARLLADLGRLEAGRPATAPRLDGEIVREGGGVQWRELARAAAGDEVLVRSARSVALVRRDRFLACGPPGR